MTHQELATILLEHCPTAADLQAFLLRDIYPEYRRRAQAAHDAERDDRARMRAAETDARREARDRERREGQLIARGFWQRPDGTWTNGRK